MRPIYLSLAILLATGGSAFAKDVTGILFGKKEITVKAKSQGEITRQEYEEGAYVREGDIIAVIDDRQEIIERDLARVEYQTAETDFKKTKKLGKYVSKEEVIQKEQAFLQKKAVYELKEYNLSNAWVISPIDGIITKAYFDKGETVSTGDKVFEVVKLDQLVMELNVPSLDAAKLSVGQSVLFKTDLHKNRDFGAKIQYISPVIDAASGTVKIRMSVENLRAEDGSFVLKPGTITKVHI